MKFRKRIRIMPGVTLNLSGSGISTTVGMRGLSVNMGKKGSYLNTGIPGTGLYDRRRIGAPSVRSNYRTGAAPPAAVAAQSQTMLEPSPIARTSKGLETLKETLVHTQRLRMELKVRIAAAEKTLRIRKRWRLAARALLIGFFTPAIDRWYAKAEAQLRELESHYPTLSFRLDIHESPQADTAYAKCVHSYHSIQQCERIWDYHQGRRVPVALRTARPELIDCDYEALHFVNANGADMYLYPGFLLLFEAGAYPRLEVVALSDLDVSCTEYPFPEREPLPADSSVARYGHAFETKAGAPDRRYKHNPQVPYARYGLLVLRSESGLMEQYLLSRPEAGTAFAAALIEYARCIGAKPAV